MESQPQHDQHITMCPQHAAEPFLPALRAGAEQAVDFEALIAAALQYGIKGRRVDDSYGTMP